MAAASVRTAVVVLTVPGPDGDTACNMGVFMRLVMSTEEDRTASVTARCGWDWLRLSWPKAIGEPLSGRDWSNKWSSNDALISTDSSPSCSWRSWSARSPVRSDIVVGDCLSDHKSTDFKVINGFVEFKSNEETQSDN